MRKINRRNFLKAAGILSAAVAGSLMTGCGGSDAGAQAAASNLTPYNELTVGTDHTDLTATIKVINHRTDLIQDGTFDGYVAEFQKLYPNITIEYEGITDYAGDMTTRLTSQEWGDVCMIPTTIPLTELGDYFYPMCDLTAIQEDYNFAANRAFDGKVYGITSTGNAQGVIYNKRVFEAAGVTSIPKTPTEFLDALQKVRDYDPSIDSRYRSIIDLYSYGHDIESSWLIDWGCALLGDAALTARIGAIDSDLARSVYQHAYRDHSLLNECERGVDDTTRVWWVQAEAVLGFVNEYEKSGGEAYGVFCSESKDKSNPDLSAAVAAAGIVRTHDLKTWERLPNLVTLRSPQQRNVDLLPSFVNGKYAFYTRPMDDFIDTGSGGGVGFGLCEDITHPVIDEEIITSPRRYHTITEAKNGEGATPIKTEKGWLHIAHGVRNTAAGLRYVIYVFVTDLAEPWKVIAEPAGFLIAPRGWERVGDVSNVVFTNGAIARDNGELYIYYAASDTRLHVASTTVDRMLDFAFHTPADPLRSRDCVAQRCALIDRNRAFLASLK